MRLEKNFIGCIHFLREKIESEIALKRHIFYENSSFF